jgi:isopentenyl diphosphate isomerase/L-lactate dehydrogenase-like FMN-dependent dehydrogenase
MRSAARLMINVADMRRAAQSRLPKAVFDYLDGGADDEITMRDNLNAFSELRFRPRSGLDAGELDLSVRVLGEKIELPIMLGPVGYSRLFHPRGEMAGTLAAGRVGTIFCVPTLSGYRLEELKAKSTRPLWYQLYPIGGRRIAEAALARAAAAEYAALLVTIDTAKSGNRERDLRNGVSELMGPSLVRKVRYVPNLLAHPKWVAGFLLDRGNGRLENIIIPGQGPMTLAQLTDLPDEMDRWIVTWEDLEWIRAIWKGPIVIKGIQTDDDARRAVDEGVQGIVVSNHGGRQLDSVAGALRVLPSVVCAVGNQVDVFMDSGIRRGSDVVKALCLGAKAVLIGRAYIYGLSAFGDTGIDRVMNILTADIKRTLILLGAKSVKDLNRSYVECTPNWSRIFAAD